MAVRYYLYISDAKVDMLLSQIDPAYSRKRVTEFSVGVTMAGAKRTVEAADTDRVTRLERVVRHLEDHADLGTVDEPGQYVQGVMPMQWSALGDGAGDTVYFGGRTERTVVGVGGSTGHVLGTIAGEPSQGMPLSASTPPVLLDRLAALTEQDGIPDPDALATVVKANAVLRGPTQTVEFVAKRMLYGPHPYPELSLQGDMAVLLASPLYVALVD
ncbi:hypothetical protein IM697_07290 [Streptomyces ferrugineus]|uniref:Uncharacterized protein n=1 Tax=Streptomyces ferrugineus TaxID=1413221 RepID=A0A7M2SP89_9ACTN|nr:SAVMC3_10250 family protein [Streptomyces ferrugineus]QOV38187.1 hypothetical protein IM697_07290 [Streptomyces ferrugineus]